MTEGFNDPGSLYILENQQWKKVGNGTLILMTNVHNPTHMILKIMDKNGASSQSNTGTVFQCKPKTKPKGNKSYILKGNDTKTNKEYILAARFKSADTAQIFKIAVENAAELVPKSPSNNPSPQTIKLRTTTNGSLEMPKNEHHQRHTTMAPDEIRKQLSTVKNYSFII